MPRGVHEGLIFKKGENGQSIARKQRQKMKTVDLGKKVYELRLQGLSLKQAAETLTLQGIPCNYARAQTSCAAFLQSLPRENADEMRALVLDRIDNIFVHLQKGIRSGNPRSAEVGLLALKQITDLLGLSADRENANQQQAVVINIQPHPEDIEARRLVADRAGRQLPEHSAGPAALLPPVEGVLVNSEDDGAVRGNGSGKNFFRSPMVLETAMRRKDADA